ncbi:hypothetical protein ETAA8_07160 [Anatilimnocola aggregata]|uniref:Uncharacterized protein n=1 Tax=Anatilimnocola aggregata TaxID=2528021 RepID=A0A517Y608_9BACT|nr:hypothetical protein ETAA8_07160 [Anatilimnocola aggregata]
MSTRSVPPAPSAALTPPEHSPHRCSARHHESRTMQQLHNRKFPLFSLAREIPLIAQLPIGQTVTPSSFAITPYDTLETSKFNFHNFHLPR